MKLTVLGGGGVRSPFLAKSIVSNAEIASISEVVFMDNDEEKLNIFGEIARVLANKINSDIKFSITTNAEEALKGADFIITTLRVGQDEGRVTDESIALNHGVLGQETTGAGGFGMALRSIKPLIEYCELSKKVSHKEALIFNFTNPSGIVTQALRDAGYENVYGICDAPSEFVKQLIAMLDVKQEEFSIKCFGLNHLSWFKDAKVNGKGVMNRILNNERLYTDTDMRLFEPELIKLSGDLLLNEYLYFYYYRDKAIQAIKSSNQTRGQIILDVNNKMIKALRDVDIEKDFEKAFGIYMSHYLIRENSYFSIESGQLRPKQMVVPTVDEVINTPDEGGYAGVALNFIKAYTTGKPVEMILSIPNNGAIKELEDSDVVEISCIIEKGIVKPIPVNDINEMQLNLIRTIKAYERYTVEAIINSNRQMAIKALTIHPLVNSYKLAKQLVDEYLEAYKKYIGEWR